MSKHLYSIVLVAMIFYCKGEHDACQDCLDLVDSIAQEMESQSEVGI